MTLLDTCRRRLEDVPLYARCGRLSAVRGIVLEAAGPQASVGELCEVDGDAGPLLAEVVAVQDARLSLLAYGPAQGLRAGARVVVRASDAGSPLGDGLLGRVIGGFGDPLDGRGPLPGTTVAARAAVPANPMDRPPVRDLLETGVRCIDALLTLGRGQRVGLFAGSGVGKSTLLARIARHAHADVNVIALVGERSREVRAFVHNVLGQDALRRSVVVASSSDQPAPARVRAAHAAVDIACDFAARGRHVMLMMDSVTRLALARREIGLAIGEPPTARGFTPSVFAELPRLCERCGTFASGGSVTAIFSVLVDGDDLNEPVADALRSVLDGHIVLSRGLAQRGHHPAIDVLRSVSRLQRDVAAPEDCVLAQQVAAVLALLERHRDAVELGLYQRGSNPALDRALGKEAALDQWLQQDTPGVPRGEAIAVLRSIMEGAAA